MRRRWRLKNWITSSICIFIIVGRQMKYAMCKVKLCMSPAPTCHRFPHDAIVCAWLIIIYVLQRGLRILCAKFAGAYTNAHMIRVNAATSYTRQHLPIIAHENRAKSTLAERAQRECECEFVCTRTSVHPRNRNATQHICAHMSWANERLWLNN